MARNPQRHYRVSLAHGPRAKCVERSPVSSAVCRQEHFSSTDDLGGVLKACHQVTKGILYPMG